MDTVADILVWACFIFGLGLFSYGMYGYIKDTIIPLWRIKYRDLNTD
jgi:hypothetical protein